MPSNVLATDVIQFNRENSIGKHYTKEEIEKRQEAEAKLKRKTVRLTAPDYLRSEHKAAALKIWKRITGEAKEIELFDNCDAGTLAAYCDVRAQYEEATNRMIPDIKKCEKLLKLMLMYAEKLGLTPVSRARLVVKRTGTEESDDKEELFE